LHADFLLDQPGDFSLMGKPPPLDTQFGINQLPVALDIEYAAAPFDQLNP